MSNPILNEKAAAEAARSGWAAPDAALRSTHIPPINDGPVSSWQSASDVMTVRGTATATGVLMVLLLTTATIGWMAVPTIDGEVTGFPALAIGSMLVGFVCAIVVSFKPALAKVLGPIYALAQGFFLGAISKAYDARFEGIVVQAVGATIGVFLVMLFLYKSRIIKVTDRFKRIVIMATFGLMAMYLVSFVVNIFGGNVRFLQSASPMGILFSVFAAGLAAMMLAVDFDLIEKGAKAGWPKGMEWYGAFGLLTTLVWLYLELLRLLAKLNQR
jgi:uncharacterized YccA/Bax inhibitor family protein